MMFYLEKSKYNSMHFSMWLKRIASFFAVKHNLINLDTNVHKIDFTGIKEIMDFQDAKNQWVETPRTEQLAVNDQGSLEKVAEANKS